MPVIAAAAAAAVTWVGGAAAAVTGFIATPLVGLLGEGLAISVAGGLLKAGASLALSAAASALFAPRVGAGGSPIAFKADPEAPIFGVMGRFGVGGRQLHANVWGKDNLYLSFAVALSLGPIQSIESFTANGNVVTFPGSQGLAAPVEPYKDKMWQTYRLGLPTDAALLPPSGVSNGSPAMSEWTSSHTLPGFAQAFWTMQNNSKRASYESGVPAPIWTLLGMKVWDPRQDSTYPGGSGSQRRDQWNTWAYSANPYLHALAWVRGHAKLNTDGTVDRTKRLAGVGAPDEAIDIAAFVEGANVADANDWTIAGEWTTADDKWQVLAAMLQAGGGVPLNRGAQISCMVEAPRTSLLTLTGADIVGSVSLNVMASRRDRPNTIVPRVRLEAQKFEEVALGPVTSSTYLAEDGGEPRTREVPYRYVGDAAQGAQLAAYGLANARETLKASIPCKPHLLGLRAGDAFTVTEPELGLNGQKFVVVKRAFDPSTCIVTLDVRSETDGKHAFALGQVADAPATPSLTAVDPVPEAPDIEDWTVSPRPADTGGTQQPGVVVTGQVVTERVQQMTVMYLPVSYDEEDPPAVVPLPDQATQQDAFNALPWVTVYSGPPTTTQTEIVGLQPGVQYWVAIGYVSIQGVPSLQTVYGPITAPGLVAERDTTPPGLPTALSLASTSVINGVGDPYVRITATWTAPADLDLAGYDVEVTENGLTVADRVATAAWSREALTGRTYAIRVRAVDLAGNVSDWTASQEIVGAGDTTAPAAPTGLSATASLGAAFLSWTNPSASDTAQVRVFENTTNNSGTASALAEVNAAPGQAGGFTRSGLSSGQTRWYWVRALDTSGNLSAFSSGVSVTVPGVGTDDLDTTPPGVPAGLALSSSVANDAAGNPVVKVVATWTAVGASDLDGYELEVIEAGGPAIIRVAGTNRDEFAARSGLSYACRVRAVDRTGNRSAFSSTVSTTAAGDTTPPAAPTGLTASASLGSVFLSATAPSAADTVSLRFFENTSNNSGSAYEVARSPARPSALVTATRAGLPNATSLFYWAKAVDASGNESGFSSVATVTTPQVQVTDFASSIRPVELFGSEAAAGTPTLGRQFFNTTDFKLYRGTGSAWVRSTDGADILADSITAGQIAAGAINTTELAAGAITAEKIGALQVTAEKIAAGAISTDKLNALSVTAEKIAAGAITAEKITAGSITGDRLAANTIDATRLTLGNRMVDVGLIWTTNSPGTNQISWSAGHVAYQNDAGGLTSVGISAGTATYTGSPAWLGIWFNRTTGTINVGDVSTPAGNPADILLAVYRGGTSLTEVYGRTTIEGDYIRTGAIDARTIAAGAITTTKLAAGAVTANEIAAGAITSDRIAAGTITGDRISTSTSLPGTVTVGTTGVQIATVEARAADPLARAVSLNTTRLTPGLIEVSGSTTLADWRQAGDLTRIAGGSISANTIDANKLQIGLRGVQVAGLVFEANPDTNVVSWSAGTIVYITDAGGLAEANIASGSLTWSGGGLFDYIYWTKGGTSLQKSTSIATANTGNNVTLATYQGGRALNGTFGRTIIDGGNIRTGSVTADRLTVTSLSAISAALGTVTSGRVQNSANTTFFDLDASRQQFTVGGYVWRQGSLGSGVLCWFGPSSVGIGSETRTNGAFAFGTDGIIYYGTAPLDPGGGGDVTVTTEINQTRAGNGYNAIAGSGWQTLSSATLSVSSGQVITVTQEFGVPSTSGPTFVGEYRVREGASTIIVAATALSIEDGGATDPINAQGIASASGSVTYYLEARQNSGGSLNAGSGAWAFTRFTSATPSTSGFMTAAQADALANAAVLATSGTPEPVGTAARGTASTAARSDHVHAHGNQAGGALHAEANGSAAGFMSPTHVTTLASRAPLANPTFTGVVTVPGGFIVQAADGANEGGEITMKGAGSNRDLQIDNFQGTLRIFDNGSGIPIYQFGTSNLTIGGNGVFHAGNYTSIPDATTSVEGLMSAADKTKLNGIAAGATANATDAALRARSSHTGTQAWSTITGAPAITGLTASSGTGNNTVAQRDSVGQLWAVALIATGSILYMHSDGTKRFELAGSNFSFTNACVAPSFTPTSDIRFKRDVTPVPDGALERVLRLDPQDFTRTGDGVAARGFIAQTLSWIDPRYVVRVRTAENQDYLAIDPVAIIADQAAAIRTLTDRLARLERLMEAVFPEAA